MNTRTTIGSFCLAMAVLLGAYPASHAAAKEEAPLTARGEEVLVDGAKGGKYGAAFLAAHAAVAAVPPQPNPKGLRNAPPRYAPMHELYAVAQSNVGAAATPLLSDVDTFLTSDKLDSKLMTAAVLSNATPRGLAEFAQQGEQEKALLDKLLADGAKGGNDAVNAVVYRTSGTLSNEPLTFLSYEEIVRCRFRQR